MSTVNSFFFFLLLLLLLIYARNWRWIYFIKFFRRRHASSRRGTHARRDKVAKEEKFLRGNSGGIFVKMTGEGGKRRVVCVNVEQRQKVD